MPHLEPQRYQFIEQFSDLVRRELGLTSAAFATSGNLSTGSLAHAIMRSQKGGGVNAHTARRVAEHYAKLHGTTTDEELHRLFVLLPRRERVTRKSSIEPLPDMIDPQKWYSTRQAAHVLGLSRQTILKYITDSARNTTIRAERGLDGTWRIQGSELISYQTARIKT